MSGPLLFPDPPLAAHRAGSKFPETTKFLEFWRTTLDGDLHSVRFRHQRLIGPNEWRKLDGEFDLH